MEQQDAFHPFVGSDAELVQLIVDTYHRRTKEDVRRSQQIVIDNMEVTGFMERLTRLLLAPSPTEGLKGLNQQNFRRSIANLIKKFSYNWAQLKREKESLLRTLFELIMNQSLSFNVRQILGIALEHQLNTDQNGSVKLPIQNRVIELFSGQNALNLLGSLLIVETAYLNSLVDVIDQILALESILRPLGAVGLLLHRFIVSMPMEEWLIKDKLIMPQITKMFELLETQVERMMDERQQYPQEIDRIRQSPYLIGLLQNYLLLFNCNQSVVSESYPQINPLKNVMLSIINKLFEEHICPHRIFHTIYMTFLAEGKNIINDIEVENILVNCINTLMRHIYRKFYSCIFSQYTMETIFSLFMYSSTNQEEYDAMVDEPEKFMQMAEQYTEADINGQRLKVEAAIFLQLYASNIDEAPRMILEMLMVILNGSLQVGEKESSLLVQIKNQFARFNFFGLDAVQKIETSLMVLATLSDIFIKRPEMNKVIIAFLVTQFQQIVKIQHPIVILRLMRAISYYPCTPYFQYIEKQLCRGPVFVLQGLKSFERILRTNKFNQLFPVIGNIICNLMNFLKVTDPIMELIIINNFDKMLVNSIHLYRLVRAKINEEFYRNFKTNRHAGIVCFNLLHVLMKKEQRGEILEELEKQFEQISVFLQNPNNLEHYLHYEDNLLELSMIILNSHASVPQSIEKFAERSLNYLEMQSRGSLFFKFYNYLVIKMANSIMKLDVYYKAFFQELARRFSLYLETKDSTLIDSFPYYWFIMSQIMAIHGLLGLSDQNLRDILGIANAVPIQLRQYPLTVFLTYLYLHPVPAVTFLKRNNMYEGFLTEVVKVNFEGKIISKILTISMIKLLQIQEHPNHFRVILNLCIQKLLFVRNRLIRPIIQTTNEPKVRRHEESTTQKQRSVVEDDNQLINLFVNFKHPFQSLCQFDLFKGIYKQNDHLTSQLTNEQKNALRSILQTQLVENRTRTIKKVKKPL